METKDENIQIEIYTGYYWQAVLVKHDLEDNGIEVLLRNENNALDAPFIPPSGWAPVIVVVSSLDFEKAKVIVSGYVKKALKGIFET